MTDALQEGLARYQERVKSGEITREKAKNPQERFEADPNQG